MADPFLGEIRMFAGNYAPYHWAFCDGQIMNIVNNEALASLLSSIYGGDERSTFGLPDMRGRIPVHFGQGTGLTTRQIGQRYGMESAELTEAQIPPHRHSMNASTDVARDTFPSNNIPAVANPGFYSQGQTASMVVNFPDSVIGKTGSNKPQHYNIMPSLVLNFIIAMRGAYPPRN
ncbi:phage tail protein [Celerinatantimonas sp. YJH-8]|uniref:phage tail protein n=1 Tax=Celerinatantimonas sp. YJH-8 TaxID=3228714 RepID=UPI0038BE36AD